MKSLRISALMLALGAFAISSIPAHAQQEVDPDHYDRSPAPAQTQGVYRAITKPRLSNITAM